MRSSASDTRQAAVHVTGADCSRQRTTAHSSSTKSLKCRLPFSCVYCACFRTVPYEESGVSEAGQPITPAELPVNGDLDPAAATSRTVTPENLSESLHPAKERLVSEFERIYLRRLVSRAGGNMARSARLAHIDRTTLYRLV